jgi:aminoglycoside phosphotransferase (APT) family kinase protein
MGSGSPQLHLPLRLDIDDPTRRWIESAVDRVATIGAVRRLRGGVTSVAQEVVVDTPRQRHLVVLRRFPPPIPRAEGMRLARAEAAALRRLEGHRIVPRLLAVDERGDVTSVPATLQTRLRGRPELHPDDPAKRAARTAHYLAEQRSWSIRRTGLRPWQPWFDEESKGEPPAWSRHPQMWATALDLAESLANTAFDDAGLLHRDFHPGNILWDHGRLAGVVDWGDQAKGPIEVDISRCRVEMTIINGVRMADRFRREAEQQLDLDYDPTWDLIVAAELAPWADDLLELNHLGAELTRAKVHRGLDQVVQRAVDELGAR